MATISATGSRGHHKFTLDVWENGTNTANNTSSCGYKFTMYGGTWDFSWGGKFITWKLNIGGKAYSGKFSQYTKNATLTLSSGNDISVSHNVDGSKKLDFSFSVTDEIGQSYTTGNCSASGSMNLTAIPRASQPSCISWPNTTDDVGCIGGTITIHMNRKSNNFTHTVRYSWHSKAGTVKTGATNNCQWSIPMNFSNDIPTAQSSWGTIYVDTYSGNTLIGTKSVKFTAHIPKNSEPTFQGVTYADTNADVVNLTEDNQKIVQNKSNLKITYPAATALNGASISKYKFTLNGVTKETTANGGTVDFGTVDSAQNVTLIATATDSRGLSTTVKKTVYMIAYSQPYATVTLVRVNNYEDTSKLTVDGSIASVNGKNAMTIKYRYKQSGGAYGDFTEIQNDAEQLFFLNKNYSFIFEVQITDLLGGNFVKEYVLNKGKFPLFIDTVKNAVGINEFPSEDEALRVKGGAGNFEDGIKINGFPVADFIVEQGISDNWTYRKWDSGVAECWGRITGPTLERVEIKNYTTFTTAIPDGLFVDRQCAFYSLGRNAWAMDIVYDNSIGADDRLNNIKTVIWWKVDDSSVHSISFDVRILGKWK